MNQRSKICVLANSIKHSDRCIAGIEIDKDSEGRYIFGSWIRPISSRDNQAITNEESILDNRRQPKILDVIGIPLLKKRLDRHHNEDCLIHPKENWTYHGKVSISDISHLINSPKNLWLEYPKRPFSPDRVSPEFVRVNSLPSLYMVRVENLELAITQNEFGKKRRAVFSYHGIRYDLALTDPEAQKKYFPNFARTPLGTIEKGPPKNSILIISLTPQFNGKYYKIVATIL